MTIDEAIKHCEEVAEKKEYLAETVEGFDEYTREECLECASEHRQLAEWLKELKQWRVYGEVMSKTILDACEELDVDISQYIKENEEDDTR